MIVRADSQTGSALTFEVGRCRTRSSPECRLESPTSESIDTGTRALLAHRLALRCGDRWQSEAILGEGLTDATRIPLASPGYGYLTDGGPLRGVQVYDAAPERIPDLACAGLRVALSH
jgi:hypothetical protein